MYQRFKKINAIINLIFTNRYREFTHEDKSKLLLIPISFFLLLKVNYNGNLVLSDFFYIFFSIIFSTPLYKRKDDNFLKKYSKSYNIILSVDFLIMNIPIIIISIFFNLFHHILYLFFLYMLYIKKDTFNNNLYISINYIKENPIINSFLRKNYYITFLIIPIYWLSYNGIIEKNENLNLFAFCSILYFLTYIINIKENMIFIKLSSISVKKYLIKICISYHLLFILLIFPILFFYILINNVDYYILYILIISLLIINIILFTKYIFKNIMIKSILDLISISMLFYVENNIYTILILFSISYISFNFSIKKLTLEKMMFS